jgi:NAD+ synthase (glutamine-hydrolysing)
LVYACEEFGIQSLDPIIHAVPTAELKPLSAEGDVEQADEVEMGMTYEELDHFGRLRKISRCGPVSMFEHLCPEWMRERELTPRKIAEKVKYFFR